VYSIVRHGDYIYVGGKFTRVVSPTGESFGATNLARFFADTGVGDKSWRPDVTGADMTKVNVYALVRPEGISGSAGSSRPSTTSPGTTSPLLAQIRALSIPTSTL
jgi:hypothetical protein